MIAKRETFVFGTIAAVLFAAFAFQLVYHAVRASAVFDEPDHILAGHRHWCGDFGINPEHPPLLKLLATAPLNFMDLHEPPWECGSKMTSKGDAYSYGSAFLGENGIDRIVITTRLAASLMSMLLAALVFLAAWEMFGHWEAVTALAILAFEPNLIAWGPLVLTDMAITATAFGAMYALYRFGKKRTWLRFAVAGLAFGLMLAAKHSAVIFAPIFFVLFIGDATLRRGIETKLSTQLLRQVTAFAGIFVIGWVILWAFYGFRYSAIFAANGSDVAIDSSMKAARASFWDPSLSVADYIKENGGPEMVESLPGKITEAISRSHLLPESYVLGMADIVAISGRRNTSLFGRAFDGGKWFYFPVAFTVKSSIPLLLLLPIGLVFGYRNREKWREMMFLLVPAVGFFAAASSSNLTYGTRYILPAYAFAIVIAGAGAVWLCRKLHYFKYFLVALLIYHATVAIRIAPNYIAFANDFWGGYENTYKLLAGDDADFGGSIKQVNEYLSRENINDCWIRAFMAPGIAKYELPCRPFPSAGTYVMGRNLIDPFPPAFEGTVVLSVRNIRDYELAPIVNSEPIAFIGGTMYVYQGRFEVPVLAAISRVSRSAYFLRVNDLDQATAEARQAVELAPNDPRPHNALGVALVQAGQKEEAKREFETTIDLAKPDPRWRNQQFQAQKELNRLSGQ